MTELFEMQGMDRLLRNLKTLETRSGRKVLRKGTRAASSPIQKAVRNAAPVGPTENLKKSIGRKFKFYRGSSTDVSVIGPRIDKAKGWKGFIGWIVEFGTGRRTVKRGWGREDNPIDVGKMPANPFAKRAATPLLASAGQKGVDAIQKALDMEVKRLGRGG